MQRMDSVDRNGKVRGKPFANADVLGKEVDGMEVDSDDEKEDMDMQDVGDDGVISASGGKVRFVSSRAYEQAMNLAIVGIQDGLDAMLKPKSKKGKKSAVKNGTLLSQEDEKWDPTESLRWENLE